MGGSNTDVDFNLSSKGAANLVFNTNSSERMRITSGGNVAIGTATPNAKFEVGVDAPSSASDTRIRISGRGNGAYGGNQYIDFAYQDYGNYGYIYKTASIQAVSYTPTGNNGYGALVFATKNASSAYNADPSEKMRITESGNVGINTTSPSEKLEVNGNIKTAAPSGYGAGAWKLGDATSGTLTPNYYIKVEINGQIYSIPALQGTP
jgi:hypothetical protein